MVTVSYSMVVLFTALTLSSSKLFLDFFNETLGLSEKGQV